MKDTYLAPERRTALKMNSSAYCGSLNLILEGKNQEEEEKEDRG